MSKKQRTKQYVSILLIDNIWSNFTRLGGIQVANIWRLSFLSYLLLAKKSACPDHTTLTNKNKQISVKQNQTKQYQKSGSFDVYERKARRSRVCIYFG